MFDKLPTTIRLLLAIFVPGAFIFAIVKFIRGLSAPIDNAALKKEIEAAEMRIASAKGKVEVLETSKQVQDKDQETMDSVAFHNGRDPK